MTELFLHIGYPKTGTTAIQAFFVKNQNELLKRGILYPKTGQLFNAHYALNFSLGIGYHEPGLKIEEPQILRERLRREIAESGVRRVLISSEYFSITTSHQMIRDYFSDYDVKILVYLRRHDDLFESGYAQAVKTARNPVWEPNINSYIAHELIANADSHNYLRALRLWAATFGKEAVVVRPYERQQHRPDIFADFLALIGVNDESVFARPPRMNIAISPQAISAIQMVRRTTAPDWLKDLIVGGLSGMEQPAKGAARYLSPAFRTAIFRRFRPSYAVIAKEFMGREDGMLFYDAPPRPDDPWLKVPPADPEACLDRILAVLAQRLNAKS